MSDRGLAAGLRESLPVAVSALPFGMAVGFLAVDGGASVAGACAMSLIIFAGAAQIAALNLTKAGAPELLVIAVVVGINLRFVMYGASLAPFLRKVSKLRRLGLAYLLTDQAFAISSARFKQTNPPARHVRYYLGTAISLWLAWQIGTLLGATLGAEVPSEVAIDFAAPLVFIALALIAIKDRADSVAAISACVTFGALHWLPFGLALLPATVVGIVAGRIVEGESNESDRNS